MINKTKNIAYVDQLCERCGSKRRVLKTWKGKIPTITGKITVVEYSQIICTNKVCQRDFDVKLREERKKRETVKRKKEIYEAAKKTKSSAKIATSQKSKLKIKQHN